MSNETPLQYLRGPTRGCGPPVEDPCSKAFNCHVLKNMHLHVKNNKLGEYQPTPTSPVKRRCG